MQHRLKKSDTKSLHGHQDNKTSVSACPMSCLPQGTQQQSHCGVKKNFLLRISGATTEPSLPSESSKHKYSTNNWWCCISVRSLDVLPATSKSWCCFAFDTSSVIPNCVICGFQTCRDGGPSLWLLLLWCLCTILQPTLTKRYLLFLHLSSLEYLAEFFSFMIMVCEYRFTFLSWSMTI